jgi:hypothetical protein
MFSERFMATIDVFNVVVNITFITYNIVRGTYLMLLFWIPNFIFITFLIIRRARAKTDTRAIRQ